MTLNEIRRRCYINTVKGIKDEINLIIKWGLMYSSWHYYIVKIHDALSSLSILFYSWLKVNVKINISLIICIVWLNVMQVFLLNIQTFIHYVIYLFYYNFRFPLCAYKSIKCPPGIYFIDRTSWFKMEKLSNQENMYVHSYHLHLFLFYWLTNSSLLWDFNRCFENSRRNNDIAFRIFITEFKT